MTSNVIELIRAGQLPYDILLELPYRNKRIGNVLPPLPSDSWPIPELEISARSKNCLIRHSLTNLSDICNFTFRELADIRFFGPGSFDEVISEYIGKIGLEYPGTFLKVATLQNQELEKDNDRSDLDLALEYIVQKIGRRESSIIRNSLSKEKIRISELSEIWGISRQRSYQIVDRLQEEIINQDYFKSLSDVCMNGWEVATISEVIQQHPYVSLGRADAEFSVSILDLLLYAGHLFHIENYLVFTETLKNLDLHEILIYAFDNKAKNPQKVSPHAAQISSDFVSNQSGLQSPSPLSGDVFHEAEKWANGLEI